jgi:hypothetical protein
MVTGKIDKVCMYSDKYTMTKKIYINFFNI